ncbi:C6 transcription factor, putative [Paecilomyces variotii No. 5]|uniref:C6 transcription factor, putative n=1 Tax=Byssochlamys spectabilis (strain No. 5 / NBRC 109023) TaxID=1356009 RepID=V5G7C2_BYSSN|nr:C6 transcription factor, putative [Paecilomyces variotii No. 5]
MSNEYPDPNRQGQYPPQQWNTSQPDENPPYSSSQYSYSSSPYPPPPTSEQERSGAQYQYPPPPPSSYPPPPNMAAIHPQMQGPQDPYRLPPPPGAYQRPPDVYGQPPPPPQLVYQAAAPRQRTAIACRYCRRRKIRCSGFESSQDGRCSNCIRFNQECMFTPVSSQAQAFVPAHAAYPHLRNQTQRGAGRGYPGDGVMLYGAHGQPLPPQQQPQPDTTLPPPQGLYQQPYGRPPHLDDRSAPPPLSHGLPLDQVSRKRPRLDEPIPSPTGSQFLPSAQRPPIGRRSSGSGFEYPDPTNLAPVSPAVSTPGYQSSPYYPAPPLDRRPSPQSAYAYDSRHSASPHSSPYPPMHHGAHPIAPPPESSMTPPPSSTPGGSASSRGGLNVRDMLNPGDQSQGGRSSTDSDMLNALNRRGLNQ